MKTHQSVSGFTLLEVLIAILVLSFGLLGLAALQAYSLKTNQSANFRSQATVLANMMIDNIRANRVNILDYYSNSYTTVACGPAPTNTTMAGLDVATWRQLVNCQLPMGRASVAPISDTEIAICIRWSDARWEGSNAEANATCTADAANFGAGIADGGSGAGTDGQFSVFVVSSRI